MHSPDRPSVFALVLLSMIPACGIGIILWAFWVAVIATPDPCVPVKTCAHPMPILIDGNKVDKCLDWQDAGVLNPQECKN